MLSSHKKKQWLRLCVLLNSCCSIFFLSCFGFNRERKVFPAPLVLLARRDSQALKACLDPRDPRYVGLWAWGILNPPNLLYGLLRTWRECYIFAHWRVSWPVPPLQSAGLSELHPIPRPSQMIIIIFQSSTQLPPPPQSTQLLHLPCLYFLFSYMKGRILFTFLSGPIHPPVSWPLRL